MFDSKRPKGPRRLVEGMGESMQGRGRHYMHRVIVARSTEAGQAAEESQRLVATITFTRILQRQIEMCRCKFGDDGEAPTTQVKE
jgi:hypothetical protein